MKTQSMIRAALVGAALACAAGVSSAEAMPVSPVTPGQAAGGPTLEKVVVIIKKRVVRRPRVIVKKTIIR